MGRLRGCQKLLRSGSFSVLELVMLSQLVARLLLVSGRLNTPWPTKPLKSSKLSRPPAIAGEAHSQRHRCCHHLWPPEPGGTPACRCPGCRRGQTHGMLFGATQPITLYGTRTLECQMRRWESMHFHTKHLDCRTAPHLEVRSSHCIRACVSRLTFHPSGPYRLICSFA